jgi:HAD superfamily hydrolase (TIGR01509 family)
LNLDTKIKAILFDYGEVLTAWVDREAALARQASLAAKLGVPVQDLWHYLFGSEIAHRWFMGEIEQDQFWRETLEPHGLADSETAVAFGQELFQSVNRVNPEMIDLLRRLHGRYKLAVLSNASWTEEELTERLARQIGQEGLFTAVMTSYSLGYAKPNPAIFLAALERLEVAPEEAVFTDDLAPAAAAAARLGIPAHHFTTPAAFKEFLTELGISW